MSLSVVMYHYVRDLPRTRWPRINGLLLDDFRLQLASLAESHEIATVESALAFLDGRYQPNRPLCLLTFDDGLKEHFTDVTPLLVEARMQGVFLIHTSGLDGRVASVHKSHFLMASLGFEDYQQRFGVLLDGAGVAPPPVDDVEVRRFYRWDTLAVARFKYLANFQLPAALRDAVLNELFAQHFGDEAAFAATLHVSWSEALEMQSAGMVLGGHSHGHRPLPTMPDEERCADLKQCATRLNENLRPQVWWPFSYPYGAVDDPTAAVVRDLKFSCAFTTRTGQNHSGQERFRLLRLDPKDVGILALQAQPCIS